MPFPDELVQMLVPNAYAVQPYPRLTQVKCSFFPRNGACPPIACTASIHSVFERLVIHCQTTGVSAAHATHCATYCTPCRPLIRAFSGWIQTPPPTLRVRQSVLVERQLLSGQRLRDLVHVRQGVVKDGRILNLSERIRHFTSEFIGEDLPFYETSSGSHTSQPPSSLTGRASQLSPVLAGVVLSVELVLMGVVDERQEGVVKDGARRHLPFEVWGSELTR